MKKIWVPVFFPTGSYFTISVDADDTADNVKEILMKKLQVNPDSHPYIYFGLFEIINKPENVMKYLIILGARKVDSRN